MAKVFYCRKCGKKYDYKEYKQCKFCKCGTFLSYKPSSQSKGEFLKLNSKKSILHSVNCGGCQELAVRYCQCHFECIFCFAINYSWQSKWKNANSLKYSPTEIATAIKKEISINKYDWLRISGGEPFLNTKRTREIIETLCILDKSVDKPLKVIIQTNGFTLANKEIQNELKKITAIEKLQILIELSLKGTNEIEFSLLTQKAPELYSHQIEGYKSLQESNFDNNISVRARMGIGPHSKSIIFVYPDTFPNGDKQKPCETMFHPSKWCVDFKQIYKKELQLYGYMAIESINVTEGSINARTQLNMPAIVRLLEKKLILDRLNGVNQYSDFPMKTNLRFPYLDNSQKRDLETQYKEIRSKFRIVPAQAYLAKNEFPTKHLLKK